MTAIKNIEKPQEILKEIEDEENPEDLFILTHEKKEDNQKKDISKKWKMLMEAFKTELELIYKNKKLEEMYCGVARKALQKCRKYVKKSDFKKLCEILRRHQSDNVKACERPQTATVNTFALNIKHPETNERLLDLRLSQLAQTQELELWQDAYKIMEDINLLLKNRKKTSNDDLLKYYQYLYEIFWNSNHYLLHSVCLHNFFACLRKKTDDKDASKKDQLKKDQLKYVNILVLAAISVPKGNNEEASNFENFRRNCFLVNSVGQVMTREQLLLNLRNGPYLDLCLPEVRSIFNLMTSNKDILMFSKNAELLFEKLKANPDFVKFLPLIEQNIIAVLFEKLSSLYKSLSFDNFKRLLGFLDFSKCEKYILYSQNNVAVKAQIDYEKGMLFFGHDTAYGSRVTSSLVNFSNNISVAYKNILRLKYEESGDARQEEKQILTNAHGFIKEASEELRNRRDDGTQIIITNTAPSHKEDLYQRKLNEEEERRNLLKQQRKMQENDMKKLSIIQERVKGIIKMDKNATYKGKKLEVFTENDFLGMSIDICIEIESEIKAKKQRAEEEKIENQFKTRDYLERLIREKRYKQLIAQRDSSQVDLETLRAKAITAHQAKLKTKEEIKNIAGFVKAFKDKTDKARKEVYDDKFADFKKALTAEFAQTIFANALKKKTEDDEKRRKEDADEVKRKELEAERNRRDEERHGKKKELTQVTLSRNDKLADELVKAPQPAYTAPPSLISGKIRGTGLSEVDRPKPEPTKLAPPVTVLARGNAQAGSLLQTAAPTPVPAKPKSDLQSLLTDDKPLAGASRTFGGLGRNLPTSTTTTATTTGRQLKTDDKPPTTGPAPMRMIPTSTPTTTTTTNQPEEKLAPQRLGRGQLK